MTNTRNIGNQISETHVNETLPKDIGYNLSDFAFFLFIMKNKKAYRNILSIILDEPNIKLKDVKVEQVILNKIGKRARYYQGLIDSPILKSGKRTKYKNLPATVIIFITQDDIFKKGFSQVHLL